MTDSNYKDFKDAIINGCSDVFEYLFYKKYNSDEFGSLLLLTIRYKRTELLKLGMDFHYITLTSDIFKMMESYSGGVYQGEYIADQFKFLLDYVSTYTKNVNTEYEMLDIPWL